MNNNIPILTIDGPSGSGKGVISRIIAKSLKWHILDSGSIYRSLAYAILKHNIDRNNVMEIINIAKDLPLSFNKDKIYLGNENITKYIRSDICSYIASVIATNSKVRYSLLELQRSFAKFPGLVTDGRDMGTVVFPNALLKIYLDAAITERVKRRYLQLKNIGFNARIEAIKAQIIARDKTDKTRIVSPLKAANDAVIIDTTNMKIVDVVTKLIYLVKQRLKA